MKLDENLGRRCQDIPAAAGHDVATVAAQGMTSAVDENLIAACAAEGHALVTLDRDFSNPLQFKPSDYAGIAFFRMPRRPLLRDLEAAARTLVVALEREDLAGKLWSVERGRVRIYQEPDND